MDHLFASPLESKTWRSFLEELLQTSQEQERVATALGVHPFTLTRWIKQGATPRLKNLYKLLDLFPEHRPYLYGLICREFPAFSEMVPKQQAKDDGVSKDFYREVLERIAQESYPSDHWSLRKDILRHALNALNTPQSDVMTMLALCTVPPPGQPVRSLRGIMCDGFPPDGTSLDHKPFVGAESLGGRVVQTNMPVFIHDTSVATRIQLPRRSQHRSMIVYPLRRGNSIAGTFTVASCTPYAFIEADSTIEEYALLLTMVCTEREFYTSQDIALQIMPPFSVQDPYLASYSQRLIHLTYQMRDRQPFLTLTEREQMVWHQIEEDLLQLAHTSQPERVLAKEVQPAASL